MFSNTYYYRPTYSVDSKQIVLQKLTYGLALAVLISALVIYTGLNPVFGLLAFVGEIISIIGYIFAKDEGTIEKLYYTFVVSTSVLLGYTLESVLAVVPGAMVIIAETVGITGLIVGGIYYYAETERPQTSRMMGYLMPLSIIFIVLAIVNIFVSFGTLGQLVFAMFGAVLFSLYLMFDLSRLMRREYVSPARMAWSIYWDILLIFRMMLEVVIGMNRD